MQRIIQAVFESIQLFEIFMRANTKCARPQTMDKYFYEVIVSENMPDELSKYISEDYYVRIIAVR